MPKVQPVSMKLSGGKAGGCGRPSALPQGATVQVVNEDERGDAATPGWKIHAVAASGFDTLLGKQLLFPKLPPR